MWLIAARAPAAARSSAAKSALITESPLESTSPDSDWLTGRGQAADGLRFVTVRVGDQEQAARVVGERKNRQVSIGQLARLAGDPREDLVRVRPGQELRGDLGAGLDPALAAPGGLVQPRVLHRDTGGGAERQEHRLVILGELPAAALVGEVKVAEHLIPHPDRDAEERLHRGMPGGKPRGLGVGRDAGQPQRLRFLDQQA